MPLRRRRRRRLFRLHQKKRRRHTKPYVERRGGVFSFLFLFRRRRRPCVVFTQRSTSVGGERLDSKQKKANETPHEPKSLPFLCLG